MYGNQINMRPETGFLRLEKSAYKRRTVPTHDKGGLTYIEGRSGEYDARERGLISDPYADGWAWAESGKSLSDYKPHIVKANRFISRQSAESSNADTIRLFMMGFNDCKELE